MSTAIQWNESLEQSVLSAIESGLTLRQVASNHDISPALILKNVKASASFCEQYARAMEIRTEQDFEQLADAIEDGPESARLDGPAWVNWKRLQIDTIKWALSKRNPKKYADRPPDVNVSATLGIQLVHAIPRPEKDTPALNASCNPPVIDAEPI